MYNVSTFFRITIPCHEMAGNIITDIAHKDGQLKASKRGTLKSMHHNAPESALENAPENALQIIKEIKANPTITLTEIAQRNGVSRRSIAKHMKYLQEAGIVKRIGPNKGGHWEVNEP